MVVRCEEPQCYGPVTVEIVALWRTADRRPAWMVQSDDTVTVVGAACDDDRAAVLQNRREMAFSFGEVNPDGVARQRPLGVYARFIDETSREI